MRRFRHCRGDGGGQLGNEPVRGSAVQREMAVCGRSSTRFAGRHTSAAQHQSRCSQQRHRRHSPLCTTHQRHEPAVWLRPPAMCVVDDIGLGAGFSSRQTVRYTNWGAPTFWNVFFSDSWHFSCAKYRTLYIYTFLRVRSQIGYCSKCNKTHWSSNGNVLQGHP